MPYKDYEQHIKHGREYYLNNLERERARKRKYYQANKAEVVRKSVARTKVITDRRKEMLSEFPCHCCRQNDPNVIQWHHINPEEKDHTIFSGGFGEERFWNEVMKCIPVCANCHLKIHKQLLCLIPVPLPTKL